VTFFVSYSRRDADAVRVLAEDLELTRHDTWLDRELGGGEEWWQEILRQIRGCEVFVLALSHHSMASRPCRAELDYAIALGLPVLPIQVGDIGSLRTLPIAERQIVDFRERARTYAGRSPSVDTSIALVVAALDLSTKRRDLPEPLPAPPPIPFEYLMQLRVAVDAPELDSRLQLQVLTQIKQALRDEEDQVARRDLVDLLRRLRQHPDITYRNVGEIDDIIAGSGEAQPDAAPDGGWRAHDLYDSATDRSFVSEPLLGPDTAPGSWPEPPVPTTSVAGPLRQQDVAPASSGSLSLVAAVLGGLGLGQAGALVAYTPTFLYQDAITGSYRFDTRPFIATMWVVLVLGLVGVAAGAVAVRRGEHHGAVATAVAAAGVLVTGPVLYKYALV